TPAVAVGTQTAIALPLAASGSFESLAALSVVARLATYPGAPAPGPLLRRQPGRRPGTLRPPGGAGVPIAARGLCLTLAARANLRNLIAGGVAVAVGLVIYLLRRRPEGEGEEVEGGRREPGKDGPGSTISS